MTVSHATVGNTPARLRRRPRLSVRASLSHAVLLVVVALTAYPILFMLNVSLKSRFQFERNPLAVEWPNSFYPYVLAWGVVRDSMAITAVITVVSLAGLLITAAATAYIFARYAFPLKDILWYALLGLLMIPGILTLVPLLVFVVHLNLANTVWAVILPYIAVGQAFAIFVMRTFFARLPEELFESARLDGAGHLDIVFRIVLPLSQPILVVVGILHVLHAWNDVAWPLLVLNNPQVRTIALQLLQFQSPDEQYPTAVFAGLVIASVPLFVMFGLGMRQFVSGVITGALKA
jgi:ABC-type glycerol-3-phosphate transport system permease component